MNLNGLNAFAEKLNPTNPVGTTHRLTTGNLLGKGWWVPMPPSFFPNSAWESLDAAMASGLDPKIVGTGPVFIDIAHLGGWKGLPGNEFSFTLTFPKFSAALQRVINQNESVSIRYLEGNTVDLAKPSDNGHGGNNVIAKSISELIHEDRRDRVTLNFANLTMDFNPSSIPDTMELLDAIEGIGDIVDFSGGGTIISDVVATIRRIFFGTDSQKQSFSWNHSKIIAVNGRWVLQGGANFWSPYAADSRNPVDLATVFEGDCAHSAHLWCEYLWQTAYKLKGGTISCEQFTKISTGWQFVSGEPVKYTGKPQPMGNIPILMANNLGIWPVDDNALGESIRYFTFDIFTTLLYEVAKARGALLLFPIVFQIVEKLLLRSVFQSGYMASRNLRNHAILNARKSVFLSQQKLVLDDQLNQQEFIRRLADINGALGTTWDGNIWDFGLVRELGTAITRPGFERIRIVSSFLIDPKVRKHDGYQDPIDKSALVERMIVSRRLDPKGGKAIQHVDANDMVEYRRIYKEYPDGRTPETKETTHSHSKMVLIDGDAPDGGLLYIGSDNAYPAYNQEFGFWIDDKAAIDEFRAGYCETILQNSREDTSRVKIKEPVG